MRPAICRTDLVVGRWGARFLGRRFPCAIGRGGIRADKREGDGATPAGVFRLEGAFFRPDRFAPHGSHDACLTTIVPHRPLRLGWRWSDDPDDPVYNTAVAAPHRWRSEALWRADPLYDLIGILDYNRNPATPGLGSAIFLHVWKGLRHPTEGCVAFRRRDLQWILDRWARESRVVIQSWSRSPKIAEPTLT